jgi:hypothetical protein
MVRKVLLQGNDDTREEDVCETLTGNVRTFYWKVLPLAMRGIIVAVFFFFIPLNQFPTDLFLTTTETKTLPDSILPGLKCLPGPLRSADTGVLTFLTARGVSHISKTHGNGEGAACRLAGGKESYNVFP